MGIQETGVLCLEFRAKYILMRIQLQVSSDHKAAKELQSLSDSHHNYHLLLHILSQMVNQVPCINFTVVPRAV